MLSRLPAKQQIVQQIVPFLWFNGIAKFNYSLNSAKG